MTVAANRAQDLIDEEFPSIYRPLVPAALKRAYASVDQAIDKMDFLGTPSGKFHRGDLVVLATEFEFLRLVKEGTLPFDPVFEEYASATGKHLVLKSPRANITINQVDYPHKKPRWARFRDEMAVPTADYLFPDWNRAREEDATRKHVLLLHGYGQLRFSNLSVPHPSENRLVWSTEDLMKLPDEAEAAFGSGGEGPTESPDAELIDDIIKTVRDAK
jgi:hypothetical protein